jgi:hypothetical protein
MNGCFSSEALTASVDMPLTCTDAAIRFGMYALTAVFVSFKYVYIFKLLQRISSLVQLQAKANTCTIRYFREITFAKGTFSYHTIMADHGEVRY